MKNIILKAALSYAKRGWRVFPILAVTRTGGCECGDAECTRPGKHPAIKGWNTEATTDLRQIESWWTDRPDRGVGIATGEESGLTVLDVDGEDGVTELGKLAGPDGMPITPTVQSRPGRFHYYFRFKAGVRSRAKKLADHLDTRSEDGYVVAPPSQHASGSVYAWLVAPEKAETAEWPEFLLGEKKATDKKRGRPEKERFNASKDKAKLEDALQHVDPDDEERWVQVGWILGRAFQQSDEGFALYSSWAGRSRKYDAKKTRKLYYEGSKQPRKGGDIRTTNSLYTWAKEAGWEEPEAELRALHVFENHENELTTLSEMATAAATSADFFLKDRMLVKVSRFGTVALERGMTRDPESFVIAEHNPNTICAHLSAIAAFWAKAPSGGWRRGKFPRTTAQTFLDVKDFTDVKPLVAFVPHPTLRADGSLLSEPGYDKASGLYLTGRVEGLEITDRWNQQQAMAMMQKEVLYAYDEYPWKSPVDRAVFVAALFTVGIRHLFETVPLFGLSSPTMGSGKTQLAECASQLWYGSTLSKASWTPNPEEMEKRIAAFLLAGDRIVCLDNITEGYRLEDSTLNKVLTSSRSTFRILGRTERVELTNEATWFATGNALQLAGDIARRSLMCYVKPPTADWHLRGFKIADLPAHVRAKRVPMMSTLLSVLRSWIRLGKPGPSGSYGSFNDWYNMLRPLLLWVGESDLQEATATAVEENETHAALAMWANALRRALPPDGEGNTTMEIIKMFPAHPDLGATLRGCWDSPTVEPNIQTIGRLMRRTENKIFTSDNPGHAFSIERKRGANNVDRWVVIWHEETKK